MPVAPFARGGDRIRSAADVGAVARETPWLARRPARPGGPRAVGESDELRVPRRTHRPGDRAAGQRRPPRTRSERRDSAGVVRLGASRGGPLRNRRPTRRRDLFAGRALHGCRGGHGCRCPGRDPHRAHGAGRSLWRSRSLHRRADRRVCRAPRCGVSLSAGVYRSNQGDRNDSAVERVLGPVLPLRVAARGRRRCCRTHQPGGGDRGRDVRRRRLRFW